MAALLDSPLLIVVLAAITLAAIGIPLLRMLVIYQGVDRRLPFDASHLGLAIPRELEGMVAGLMRLGFRRLGEAQLDLPGLRLVQFGPTGSPTVEGPATTRHSMFLFVDQTGTIIAETGHIEGSPVLVSLWTSFADGTVVETMYPLGESIDDADFHCGHVSSSLEAAYDEQRLHVDRWRMRHGTPKPVASVDDYLRDEANYRARFARRKLRGPLVRRQLVPALVATVLVVVAGAFMIGRWPG